MTEPIVAGSPAPRFTLPSTEGTTRLDALVKRGRVVIAFYSEDGTPSCESQLAMLKDAHDMILEFGASVVAVSSDSLESHRTFAERLGGLPFPLAADVELAASRAYGVVDEGDSRRSRRAVFVIDRDGTVLLALSHFQPANLSQVEAIFAALGAE